MKGYKAKKMIGLGLVLAMAGTLAGCGTGVPSGDLMADYNKTHVTISGDGSVENQSGQMVATMTDDQGYFVTDGGQCTNEEPAISSGDGESLYEDGTLALSDFGVRLMQECFADDKNVLISPLSVISALGMTANGAKEETYVQMEKVFRMEIPVLNVFLKEYRENLPSGKKYKMNLANGIWFRDSGDFTANEDFLQTNETYYNAGLYKAPFDVSTKDQINAWVNKNTDGMIKSILNEIPIDAVMYLVNALAFDGEWQTIYNESRVHDKEFTTENGRKQNVTMMYSEEKAYLEDEQAQGFLKYYADRKYAFVGLLPKDGVTVGDYMTGLDGEALQNLLDNQVDVKVNAGIPKFKLEYDVEMSDVLKAMGMTDVFDPNSSNLSALGESANGNLYVSRVLHKTFIEVDERGTKAGAATAVEVKCESAMLEPEEVKTVILDRPFVYMIIDCEKQVPIFIGTMMNME